MLPAARTQRTGAPPEVTHHFTVDVEEYFQVSAFEGLVPRASWPVMESRLDRGMERILSLLEAHDTRGTFFVLGAVAEEHPRVVRELAAAGHEIASHGWDHRRVFELSPEEFRHQVRESRSLLQELSGQPVWGYRAPSFSILPGGEWALEILVEEGYLYDSSLYPVRRGSYGYPGGRRDIHVLELRSGRLTEVPPATLRVAGVNVQAGGGATFRHLPYGFTRTAFRVGEGGGPATFYIHPWELDPDQPRIPGLSWATRLRHYGGLRRTASRLDTLLGQFRFRPIAETLSLESGRYEASAGSP